MNLMKIIINRSSNLGASMLKWTKKVLQYPKTIIFLVKRLIVVAKCCLD